MNRITSILLLVAVVTQSLFGGLGLQICLGGGHTHQTACIDSCEQACGHSPGLPTFGTSDDEAHNECGCLDLELAVEAMDEARPSHNAVEFFGGLQLVAIPVSLCVLAELPPKPQQSCVCHPPPDVGRSQQLAAIASTRLII